jgi:HPt (histidine-containing phosphotransfer) domain-containing protein
MDGPAATRAIRSLEGPVSTIPIFALTADALIQRSDVYAAIGLTGFLAKPIDVAKLRAALNTVSNTPAFMSGSYNQQEIASNPRDAELPVFNQSMIVDLRQDLGADLVTELLNILVNDVTARCAALSLSVAAGTFAETGRIAHAIKGAAGNLCAVRLERAAAHLETAAANADPGLEDQASVLLDVAAITCREAVLI